MQKKLQLKLAPAAAANPEIIRETIAVELQVQPDDVSGFHILKKSIDSRSKNPFVLLQVEAFINEPFYQREIQTPVWKPVHHATKKVCVIGVGPAGLFAALRLIEQGIKPILFERGKNVKERRRDLASLNKKGILNTESNYCFGEGGAGTYSDGKLYTRSKKRGNINRILNILHHAGAPENILFDAHPHIGTNKLPAIITTIRETILHYGGEIHFEKKLTGFEIQNNKIKKIRLHTDEKMDVTNVILATGHSASDIFEILHRQHIALAAKPFALGVRIEHPQSLINTLQYHAATTDPFLPPASYSLVTQVRERGVFSFCMCPGGIIAPAATHAGQLVVNGWSPSKRNNPFANSGIVVEVTIPDALAWMKSQKQIPNNLDAHHPLLLLYFQAMVEKAAFAAGGGNFVAPAQRMADFCAHTFSTSLPPCSYVPGVQSAVLNDVLPSFISKSLQEAFLKFGENKRNRSGNSYFTNEAIVVATESRTSSPVRIPRLPDRLHHPVIHNLYPCGEGAGYAGGIVSAAMDGEKVADAIARQ